MTAAGSGRADRVAGHSLVAGGAPFQERGRRTAGKVGSALCSCGVLSPPLANTSRRKAWHRDEHKPSERERAAAADQSTEALRDEWAGRCLARSRPDGLWQCPHPAGHPPPHGDGSSIWLGGQIGGDGKTLRIATAPILSVCAPDGRRLLGLRIVDGRITAEYARKDLDEAARIFVRELVAAVGCGHE